MKTERVALSLDSFEQRLMVKGLVNFRNGLLSDARPTEDVEELILKVIDAPKVSILIEELSLQLK